MSANKLKLNLDKTEFIVFRNKKQHAELASFFPTDILGTNLVPAVTVNNFQVLNLTHVPIYRKKYQMSLKPVIII